VCAYPFKGYWRDVGTLKAYWDANMDCLNPGSGLDLNCWGVRTNVEEEGRVGDRTPAFLAPGCKVRNSIIPPGCRIYGTVENSVLSPGVEVGTDAKIRNSVIMHNTKIKKGAVIDFCILDKNVKIGAGAMLGTDETSVPNKEKPDHLDCGLIIAGKGAEVPDNYAIGKNTILFPKVSSVDYPGNDVAAGETIRPKAGEAYF
jgi:glucose-1-phosphate adenylyltransferase